MGILTFKWQVIDKELTSTNYAVNIFCSCLRDWNDVGFFNEKTASDTFNFWFKPPFSKRMESLK